MKVLLVGGGRRYSFTERLIKSGCDVYAYETNIDCPIKNIAKVIKGLPFNECLFDLYRTVKENNIDLIVPLYDEAIYECSTYSYFSGKYDWITPSFLKKVVTSSPNTAEICLDKKQFECWMLAYFRSFYPEVCYDWNEIIAKPRQGCNSQGIQRVRKNPYRHYNYKEVIEDDYHVYQEFIQGKEYTVDLYSNKVGTPIEAVPRLRERVDGGEVVNASIVKDDEIRRLAKRVAEKLNIRGPCCIQIIKENGTGKLYVIEVNARFGGGCILSLEAGFDMIRYMITEYYNNEIVLPSNVSPINWNLKMRRVHREVFTE